MIEFLGKNYQKFKVHWFNDFFSVVNVFYEGFL